MVRGTLEKLKQRFQKKQIAYNNLFAKPNVHAEEVLKDLAKFCRAHDPTFHTDQRTHALLEGRREVWLRIENFLNLSIEEIYELHRVHDKEG